MPYFEMHNPTIDEIQIPLSIGMWFFDSLNLAWHSVSCKISKSISKMVLSLMMISVLNAIVLFCVLQLYFWMMPWEILSGLNHFTPVKAAWCLNAFSFLLTFCCFFRYILGIFFLRLHICCQKPMNHPVLSL